MIHSRDISIVIHGPADQKSIVDFANNCEIYRNLFPESEIICVISSEDLFSKDDSGKISKVYRDHYYVNAAIAKIKKITKDILLCKDELQLPPLKDDTGKFNGNHQIEAAKLGLESATRKFVLRIRSDVVFCSDKFLEFYENNSQYKRSDFAIFKNRVLISSAFTLNPYAMERFPFHWGDWFHFGLLDDVKALWNVDVINPKDLLYYKHNPHAIGSNRYERRFFSRFAVEQHIHFSFFKKFFPNLTLEYINDCTSRNVSIGILKDNFVVCDPYELDFVFEKYKDNAQHRRNRKWLITHDLWKKIIEHNGSDFEEILSFSQEDVLLDRHEPFPRTYLSTDFSSKIGHHNNNNIVLNSPWSNGVLVHGPYVYIPSGRYNVTCYFDSSVAHYGKILIKVTLETGRIELFSKALSIQDIPLSGEPLEVSFDFESNFALGSEMEIVIEVESIEDISFSKAVISRLSDLDKKEMHTEKENQYYSEQNNLNYAQLSKFLKFMLLVSFLFSNKNQRRKLKKNTKLFLDDSKNSYNHLIKKFYDIENSKI